MLHRIAQLRFAKAAKKSVTGKSPPLNFNWTDLSEPACLNVGHGRNISRCLLQPLPGKAYTCPPAAVKIFQEIPREQELGPHLRQKCHSIIGQSRDLQDISICAAHPNMFVAEGGINQTVIRRAMHTFGFEYGTCPAHTGWSFAIPFPSPL